MSTRILAGSILWLAVAPAALAGEHGLPTVTDPLVLKECGGCHMAFPPALLPARSWQRMIDQLDRHFGEDASVPVDKREKIRAYLTANAGDATAAGRNGRFMRWVAPGGVPQRFTDNPAFQREHAFPDRVWKDPAVVTRSNCPACHRRAQQGWFDDN